MITQKTILFPNTNIIKEFYEFFNGELVYMEETNIEETNTYGLDYYLNEYEYLYINYQKILMSPFSSIISTSRYRFKKLN